MGRIKAIILDLYGTLAYMPNETKPYSKLFNDLKLDTEERKKCKKIALTENFNNLPDFLNKILQNNLTIDIGKYETMISQEARTARLFPETRPVLEALKNNGLKLGVISNLATPYIKPFYDLGLDSMVDYCIFSCKTGLKKPDPKIYRHMAVKLSSEPEEVLMVGDSIYCDVLGPQSLGMNAILLDRQNTSTYHNRITTLSEILEHI